MFPSPAERGAGRGGLANGGRRSTTAEPHSNPGGNSHLHVVHSSEPKDQETSRGMGRFDPWPLKEPAVENAFRGLMPEYY